MCGEVERLDEAIKHTRQSQSTQHIELSNVNNDKLQLQQLCTQQATEIQQVSQSQQYSICVIV